MPDGQVYLIATKNLKVVKIGWSTNLEKRLNDLGENARAWSVILGVTKVVEPSPLMLLSSFEATEDLATYLIEKWRSHRAYRDWFRFEGELRTWAVTTMDVDRTAWETVLHESRLPRAKATIDDHPSMKAVRRNRPPEQDVNICPSCWGHDGVHKKWCVRKVMP